MKNLFRYLTFLTCLLIMVLGAGFSANSRATSAKGEIDPACMTSCQQQHSSCFVAAGGRNSAENHCLAEYRYCIAQCGKR